MKTLFVDASNIIWQSLTSPFADSTISRSHRINSKDTLASKAQSKSKSPSPEAKTQELEEKNRNLQSQITINPMFKLGFWAALLLTIASLILSFLLVPKDAQTILSEQQKQLFETCTTTWKMGFGAIIGLIGGKVA